MPYFIHQEYHSNANKNPLHKKLKFQGQVVGKKESQLHHLLVVLSVKE